MGLDKLHTQLNKKLVDDFVLTKEEGQQLLKLQTGLDKKGNKGFSEKVDVLTELKKADNSAYQDICYEIGESFLFYFDVSVERDRYSNAAKWFKEASSKYPIADIYCKMSDCLELINQYNGAKIKQTDNIYGEYEKLWSMVGELKSKADEFDSIDSKLQVWREINDMIDNNVSPFLEVTSANDLKSMLNGISSEAGKVTKSVVESDIKDLQSKIADTVKKIESASNQGV